MIYRPRIMAVDNVQLFVSRTIVDALDQFYADWIGFERYKHLNRDGTVVYRGRPRSGPRLVVNAVAPEEASPLDRPPILIEMFSLNDFVERIETAKIRYTWIQGWSFYDRKLVLYDPAGHRLELLTIHLF